jgi:hypothetical protein
MEDQEFRDHVVSSLAELKTLATQQKDGLAFVHAEHKELDDTVDKLKTRVNWFSGVGAAVLFAVSSYLGIHHVK